MFWELKSKLQQTYTNCYRKKFFRHRQFKLACFDLYVYKNPEVKLSVIIECNLLLIATAFHKIFSYISYLH